MDYDTVVELLLIVAIGGFAFGMLNHKRLIHEGGQRGFFVSPDHALSRVALRAKRRAFLGYGLFGSTIAIMLILTAIFGPAKG